MTDHDLSDQLEAQRTQLRGLAYRMLGSLAEAEDVVQDAFLRLRDVDRALILDLAGYLHTTVARLCLDRLKSAQARREVYVGTWLPEPLVEDTSPPPDAALDLANDVSFALLMTLERLTPPERTAFLLHDVFGRSFEEIAEVLQRTAASCRKLAERARAEVHASAPRPRAAVTADAEQRLLQAFFAAAGSGDVAALKQVLADDAVIYMDGGGKRKAAHNPLYGADHIARFFAGIRARADYAEPERVELRRINQLPGCVAVYAGGDVAVGAFELDGERIARIYVVNNPDKLAHLVS
ncbi:MAG: RNA polymerase sigma factor SigJ [Polyangiales bacterium]